MGLRRCCQRMVVVVVRRASSSWREEAGSGNEEEEGEHCGIGLSLEVGLRCFVGEAAGAGVADPRVAGVVPLLATTATTNTNSPTSAFSLVSGSRCGAAAYP